MDIQSMHTAVQQGVDKINSFQADSLLPQEIDLELNKSIMRFVNLKYGKNNIYRQGFEESQKRIDDLRNLVTSNEDFVYFKERRILKFGVDPSLNSYLYIDKYSLPTDYLYHISSYCNSFKSLNCRKNVNWRLTEDSGRNYIVKVKLDDLKISGGKEGRDKGWAKNINLVGGAAPAEGYDEIDLENIASIGNIGGKNAFTQPLWDASDDFTLLNMFASSFSNTSNQNIEPIFNASASCRKEVIGENGVCDGCGDYTAGGVYQDYSAYNTSLVGTKPTFIAQYYTYKTFYLGLNDYLEDPDCSNATEIINAILNSSKPGTEVYYENYQDQNEPETFFFILDPVVYNYMLLEEQAEAISQELGNVGASINVDSNEIVFNDTSNQPPSQNYTTFASVPITSAIYVGYTERRQVYIWAQENLALANDFLNDSFSCESPSSDYDQSWSVSESVALGTGPQLVVPGVMDDIGGVPVDNLVELEQYAAENPGLSNTLSESEGSENTINPRYINIDDFVIEGTKKRMHASIIANTDADRVTYADGSQKIYTDTQYWDQINNQGKDFAGVSQPIKYIQHDDILALLKDPFNRPDNGAIFGVFDGNYINVYTLVEGTKHTPVRFDWADILPHSVKLTYLRAPKKVSLEALTSCDLPEHTHQEIVAMTVSGILEGIGDPRFKTQAIELNKHE